MIYFISGHRDLTKEEFRTYYIPKIDKVCAFDKNVKFVVGDYWGADTYAQDYLANIGYADNVTVYHMNDKPMYINELITHTKPNYKDDIDRDSAMTRESDFDIAFIREGKINSGTEQNIMRRITFK